MARRGSMLSERDKQWVKHSLNEFRPFFCSSLLCLMSQFNQKQMIIMKKELETQSRSERTAAYWCQHKHSPKYQKKLLVLLQVAFDNFSHQRGSGRVPELFINTDLWHRTLFCALFLLRLGEVATKQQQRNNNDSEVFKLKVRHLVNAMPDRVI